MTRDFAVARRAVERHRLLLVSVVETGGVGVVELAVEVALPLPPPLRPTSAVGCYVDEVGSAEMSEGDGGRLPVPATASEPAAPDN